MSTASKRSSYYGRLASQCERGWQQFWFQPQPVTPLLRIRWIVGAFSGYYYLSFTPDLLTWFGPQGLWPRNLAAQIATNFGTELTYRFSILQVSDQPAYLIAIHILAIGLSILLIWGRFLTRFVAVGNLLILLSYTHRAPLLGGPFETVLALLALYLCLEPGAPGIKASRGEEQPVSPATVRAAIALRWMQVHVTAVYLSAGLSMLAADTWWTGMAVWDMVALPLSRSAGFARAFGFPQGIYLINLLTHLIVAFHLMFPILVWNQYLRRAMIHLCWMIWTGIAVVSGQWSYSILMASASAALWHDADYRQ